MRSLPMLKCSSERWVCAPHSLSAGTLTSPRLSVSLRTSATGRSSDDLCISKYVFLLSPARGEAQTPVIPTGAERSEAEWRDLFCRCIHKKRSLDCAALRAASLGMTERLVARRLCPERLHRPMLLLVVEP